MKYTLLIVISLLSFTKNFNAQSTDVNQWFTVKFIENKGLFYIEKKNLTLNYDYCFEGEIKFYDSNTGMLHNQFDITGSELPYFSVTLEKALKSGFTLKFNASLSNCDDGKGRIVNEQGISFGSITSLNYTNAIMIELDQQQISAYRKKIQVKELERQKDDAKKQASKRRLEQNSKQQISIGDLLYVCNRQRRCQVIAQTVTKEKVKVEFIEQCHPKKFSTISTRLFISEGDTRWIEKKYLHKNELNCYEEKSPF